MMSLRVWRLALPLAFVFVLVACGGEESGDGASSADEASDCETGVEQEVTEGLTYTEIECGDGEEAASGDMVTVHYTGTLEDGTEFDSSRGREPFEFALGSGFVIQGWEQGIPGMKVGGVRELTIAPELAYGEAGAPPDIPPNSTLIFEVELLEVAPGE